MNKEQLIKEKNQCKKNFIKYGILSAVFMSLTLSSIVYYVIFCLNFEENDALMATGTIIYVLVEIACAILSVAFMPATISNIVKFIIRSKKINRMNKDEKEGVIDA